jgi:hypothetical protein
VVGSADANAKEVTMRSILFSLLLVVGCAKGGGDTNETDTDADSDDRDADGTVDAEDCGPDDAARHPGAVELCNLVDEDCDGTYRDIASTWGYENHDGSGEWRGSVTEITDADLDVVTTIYASSAGETRTDTVYVHHVAVDVTVENDDDPEVDARTTSTLDAQDRVTSSITDVGDDGSAESGYDCTYAGDGTADCVEWYGSTDFHTRHWQADAHGQVTLDERDQNFDGYFDGIQIVAYTYDADGHALTQDSDWGNDGVDDRVTYTWVDGRKSAMTDDYYADGSIDLTEAWTYENGLVTSDIAAYTDGSGGYTYTWTYDDQGRLIAQTAGPDLDTPDLTDATTFEDTTFATHRDSRGSIYEVTGGITCP